MNPPGNPANHQSDPPRQPQGMELAPGVRVPIGAVSIEFGPASGPGGQNVNRRSTRAIVRANVAELGLTAAAADRLRANAGTRLTDDDVILITGDEHRSQRANREACLARLAELIVTAKKAPKKRRPTKPTRGSVERRIGAKKRRADIKKGRRWSGDG